MRSRPEAVAVWLEVAFVVPAGCGFSEHRLIDLDAEARAFDTAPAGPSSDWQVLRQDVVGEDLVRLLASCSEVGQRQQNVLAGGGRDAAPVISPKSSLNTVSGCCKLSQTREIKGRFQV